MTSFPKKHVLQIERRNYLPKKLIQSQKNNVTVKDKGHSLFLFYYFQQVFVG